MSGIVADARGAMFGPQAGYVVSVDQPEIWERRARRDGYLILGTGNRVDFPNWIVGRSSLVRRRPGLRFSRWHGFEGVGTGQSPTEGKV